MVELIITIDGPAASGKSTVARLLASRLGITFLDTGAMYRAVTLAAMQKEIDLSDQQLLLEVLQKSDFQFSLKNGMMKVSIDGGDVTEKIRDRDVTVAVQYIALAPRLRAKLVQMQRDFAEKAGSIVTEGRDQGTVAFPNADFKFFLTADVTERARRRQKQLRENGQKRNIKRIQKDIEKRDASDEHRTIGPLTPADNAIIIDTTDLRVGQVVQQLLEYIKAK